MGRPERSSSRCRASCTTWARRCYPLGVGSPFFRSLALERHGLEWVHPDVPLAHPLDGGRAVVLHRSLRDTAAELGRDAGAYHRLLDPLVRMWPTLADHVLTTPLRPPRHPLLMARFGLRALRSAVGLADSSFRTEEARALLAGNAAHSGLPLDRTPSAAIGLVLMAAGHAVGWPVPRGGAGALTRALASLFESLGGVIETRRSVRSLDELPVRPRRPPRPDGPPGGGGRRRRAPDGIPRIPGEMDLRAGSLQGGLGAGRAHPVDRRGLPPSRHGPPGRHAGGDRRGRGGPLGGSGAGAALRPAGPAEPSSTRPARRRESTRPGRTATSPTDGTATRPRRVEAQVERFAPGFLDRVKARSVHAPRDLEAWDANLVGGDVNGGAATLAADVGPPRPVRIPLVDAGEAPLRVLGLHAARGRRTRDVRLPRGAHGAAQDVRARVARARSAPRVRGGLALHLHEVVANPVQQPLPVILEVLR